jgi:hypothetical protein
MRTNIDYTFISAGQTSKQARFMKTTPACFPPSTSSTGHGPVHEQLVPGDQQWRPATTFQVVFWYRMTRDGVRMCSPQYWALSAQAANDDDEPAQELYDIDKFLGALPKTWVKRVLVCCPHTPCQSRVYSRHQTDLSRGAIQWWF